MYVLDPPHETRFQRTYTSTKIVKCLENSSKLIFYLIFSCSLILIVRFYIVL